MRAVVVALVLALVVQGQTPPQKQATVGGAEAAALSAEFEKLRLEGNEALYNLDYATAREIFQRMTRIAPEHPAGYIYLANNSWLETLNASRRLSSSLYVGSSFYDVPETDDKVDPKRDREFDSFIKQAIAYSRIRLDRNPKDVEALYYQAAAQGLRASYKVTVKRSFRLAIGDANESVKLQRKVIKLDPTFVDAYLSIGLYDYVVGNLPPLWAFFAKLAGFSGDEKRGIAHLERVTREGKYTSDDARVVLIGIYTREGRPEEALKTIEFLANKYRSNYLFGVERAAMLCRLNRPDEGAAVFASLLGDQRIAQEASDLINYQWGQALSEKGNHAAAIERYQQVIQWPKADDSLKSLAHLYLGRALDAVGRSGEAVAHYTKVLARDNVFDSHKQASQACPSCSKPTKAAKKAEGKKT
jgi:tetratricopeptide (TPR) repeat protein